MEEIGEVNFKGYKTKFKITPKVKTYLEEEKISLACLLPNAWEFYEAMLFDHIKGVFDKPKKDYGKKFLVIYNKITEHQGWNKEKGLETTGFEEKIENQQEEILNSGTKLSSVKNPKKEFIANYTIFTDN